jgi:hypothetical protein
MCEVCATALARRDDILCPDCSRAFTLLLELLRGHPELAGEDLARIRQVFEWRMHKFKQLPAIPASSSNA